MSSQQPPPFNWVFLGFMILSGVLSLFFLFYFNRAFAYLTSLLLRFYLHSTGNPRYIRIQSIQISPLAGRVFFGGLVYHGPNETIRVVGGHVTWRWWLRRVRDVDAAGGAREEVEGGGGAKGELPCRMLVDLRGVEWFVYNRSQVFDALLMRVLGEEAMRGYSAGKMAEGIDTGRTGTGSTTLAKEMVEMVTYREPVFEEVVQESWYLRALPIQVECWRGSLVLGNETTPSMLVGHFERAAGIVGAKKAASIDLYQQFFDFRLEQPVIKFKPNPEYKCTLLELARGQQTPSPSLKGADKGDYNRTRRFLRLFSSSKPAAGVSANRPGPTLLGESNQWMGLSRYHMDTNSAKLSAQKEYAEVDEIVACEHANFLMYWDVVGKVPPQTEVPGTNSSNNIAKMNINGSQHPAPEWGIKLAFKNTHMNYGPWADRQRIHLQNMFFPRVYRASTPAQRRNPGMDRVYTEMKLAIDFEGDTTLRIPVREPSKDWKYRQPREHNETRPPGWLDIKMATESTLTYNMALVAAETGWSAELSLDMRSPEVSSSVNGKTLWKAQHQALVCDLSSPLKWSEDTHWVFNNVSNGMEVFLLREHIILLTDLIADWTSGPPGEYETFTPMVYELNLIIKDSEFFFNVNDQNIINNASNLEDNTFIVLRHMGGDHGHLSGKVVMDFREFRPRASKVDFCIETIENLPDGRAVELAINTPPWNTWYTAGEDAALGTVRQIALKGFYEVNSGTADGLVDTLVLDLQGDGLELILRGYLIRYFLLVRENYFGENMHFRTLDEWTQVRRQEHAYHHHTQHHNDNHNVNQQGLGNTQAQAQGKVQEEEEVKSNDIDVQLKIAARDLVVLLPEHIDGGGERVKMGLADLGVDLRFTNYYMDLQVDVSPVTAFVTGPSSRPETPQVFVDGLKLYGHRLFGLPPTEPTYICNWDFDIGSITGECTLEFIHSLLSAAKTLVFGFKDSENALPEPVLAVIHDLTLLRLFVADVRVWVRASTASAVRIETKEISVLLNDLADLTHSERIVLDIPGLNVAVVDPSVEGQPVTRAYVDTDVVATVLGRVKDAENKRRLQQEHIRISDNRTKRAPFFVDLDYATEGEKLNVEPPPSIPVPGMPPVMRDEMRFKDGPIQDMRGNESLSSWEGERKSVGSFFLSDASTASKAGSIIRHHAYSPSSTAPSFYSAVESMSELQSSPSLLKQSYFRSASSTYSLHSLSRSQKRDITPPSASKSGKRNSIFSQGSSRPVEIKHPSLYIPPAFPLHEITPDTTSLPILASLAVTTNRLSTAEKEEQEGEGLFIHDATTARTSFIIEFTPGIRGFVASTAIKEVLGLLGVSDPTGPDDVLDAVRWGVMGKLEKLVKGTPRESWIKEVCIKLPQVNLNFINELSPSQLLEKGRRKEQEKWRDVVTLQLMEFVAAVRVKAIVDDPILGIPGPAKKAKKKISAHIVLESLHASIKDASPSPLGEAATKPAAASIGLSELLFYTTTIQNSTTTLSLRTLASSFSSTQSAFLETATQRLITLTNELITTLANASGAETYRLQRFIAELAHAGERLHIHDPASITRPSYVLRTAPAHVRLKDSWKIAERLRFVWVMMSERSKGQWREKYARPREAVLSSPPSIILSPPPPPSPPPPTSPTSPTSPKSPTSPLSQIPRTSMSVSMSAPLNHHHQGVITGNETTLMMRDHFVAVMQRWRGWELGDIHGAKIVELVFGKRKQAARPKSAKRKEPFARRLLVEEVKVVVDPGPAQHELAIGGIEVVGMVEGTEKKRGGGLVGRQFVPAEVVVEIGVEEMKGEVRWEVVELVKAVMERIEHNQANSRKEKPGDENMVSETADDNDGKVQKPQQQSSLTGIHVLFTLNHGALILDTVNLTSTTKIHNLAASAIVSRKLSQTPDTTSAHIGSLLLRADQVSSDLNFGSALLASGNIIAPSAYVHFDQHSLAETKFNMWKIGAMCEEASFRLEEQVLGILEAAEHVIEDEIAQIYQLVQQYSKSSTAGELVKRNIQHRQSEKREVHMVHGAIAAERFVIAITILQSLAYELRGKGVNMSVKPDSKDPKELVVEMGVESHDHDLVSIPREGEKKSIATLSLPTIRTTLRGQNGEEERTWDLKSCVEEITLEAAAVQSFLNALGKQEVVQVAETSADEIGKMSLRVGEIVGSGDEKVVIKKSSTTKKTAPPLVYRASLDVAGFRVQAYAPSANLTLSLDFIRARATNKQQAEKIPSGFPEALLEFGKISLELTRATETDEKELCGYLELHTSLSLSPKMSEEGVAITTLAVQSHSLKIDLYADTASTVVSVVGHLQDRLKEFEIPKEVRNQVQRLQTSKSSTKLDKLVTPSLSGDTSNKAGAEVARISALFNTEMTMDLNGIKISWIVGSSPVPAKLANQHRQDLVLSVKRIHFETSTKRDSDAQLRIEEFLLQMVDGRIHPTQLRTQNSALLPQVEFKVTYRISGAERRVALQAKGETLDVRLNSSCIVAGNAIQQSIAAASQKFRSASASWKMKPTENGKERKNMFTTKRLASVIVDADFAGAVVNFFGTENEAAQSTVNAGSLPPTAAGRLTADEGIGNTVLRSPGLAFKIEYIDTAIDDPSLNAEIKVSASNNILYPSVVPLILEMSENVKEIMKQNPEDRKQLQQTIQADTAEISASDTAAILGRCRLNVGFRICQQKFTLSCQPLERVAASAQFEQIYITINTCDEPDNGRFYASSATVKGFRAELKHLYSRDSAGEFGVDNIILSLMNSRHVTGSQGLSCILKIAPIQARVNVNQFRDYLVFREIWTPKGSAEAAPAPSYSYDGLAQRYHEVAATKAFPSNTSLIISEIGVTIDFGLKIGKSAFRVKNLWGTSKKTSDWEQSLAIGFDEIKLSSEGRLSGFANLAEGSLSSSIAWDPTANPGEPRAPRINAAVGFENLQLKVAFESEVFMLAEVGFLKFVMYNLHNNNGGDRLEARVTGDKLHLFCTAVTAARSVALKTVLRGMMEEKRKQFRSSLEDIEKFMRRRTQLDGALSSVVSSGVVTPNSMAILGSQKQFSDTSSSPSRKGSDGLKGEFMSLHTDVMVDISHIFIGVFPSTLGDTRIFRVEATKATARFAREIENKPPTSIISTASAGAEAKTKRVHSSLEMVFEDFNVEVPSIKQNNPHTALHADVVMEDVVRAARAARGSPVLRVPKHTATMSTWDGGKEAVEVELEFGNKFLGQVTIGWDLSRIGFIKLLYGIHKSAMEKQLHGNLIDTSSATVTSTSKYAVATDLLLSPSTISTDETTSSKLSTGTKTPPFSDAAVSDSDTERRKIKEMPVVKVPQSKYIYIGRSMNVETPQLRDMGEATPPLEWLGVNMERLPQVTHQYVIVTLQEIARTVEDRYWKILGS